MSSAVATTVVSRTFRTPDMMNAPHETDRAVSDIAAGRRVMSPLFASALNDGYGERMTAQAVVTVVVAQQG